MTEKQLKRFIKERDEVVQSFSVSRFKAFYRKWEKLGIYKDVEMPSDEVIEITMRKCVCGLANPDPQKLKEAMAWLAVRGYSWMM